MSGCNTIVEKQVKKSFELYMTEIQSGNISQDEIDDMMGDFLEGTELSEANQKDLADAFINMLTKLSYTVTSCKKDANDKNTYVISVDLKTVDGSAILMNDALMKELVGFVFIKALSGGFEDMEQIEEEVVDLWAQKVLEASKTAAATKDVSTKFTIKYDPASKSYDYAGSQEEIMSLVGLEGSGAASLQDEIRESIAKKMNPFSF
jgi:hypothetical protein